MQMIRTSAPSMCFGIEKKKKHPKKKHGLVEATSKLARVGFIGVLFWGGMGLK